MTEKNAVDASWIPVGSAVIRLRGQYEHAGVYGDKNKCFRAATNMLLRRLSTGQLLGRAKGFEWDKVPQTESGLFPNREIDGDGLIAVPAAFWAAFYIWSQWSNSGYNGDWVAGDFEFFATDEVGEQRGHVIGLEVWDHHLPPEFDRAVASQISSPQPMIAEKNTGGRPAAKWWPDFAIELALFIHEEGVPLGSGHDGQSEMLEKIFRRLSAAGKEEPSRTTVQPVINAVLRGIRSAGN